MAKKQTARAKIDPRHPLVGTWGQAPNKRHVTSVVYSVFAEGGRFRVTATDRNDGAILKISGVRWDGESLHFKSFYARNRHTASHVLTAVSGTRMHHEVSGLYADGESFAEREVWTKKAGHKKSRAARKG